MDAGMQTSALVSSMPTPSYAFVIPPCFLKYTMNESNREEITHGKTRPWEGTDEVKKRNGKVKTRNRIGEIVSR
jgi:hypothetical protein